MKSPKLLVFVEISEDSKSILNLKNLSLGHIVNFLIKKGANVNEKANCKNTPLILSAWHGQAECAKILINANANIHSKQCDGFTALHFAAEKDFGKKIAEGFRSFFHFDPPSPKT